MTPGRLARHFADQAALFRAVIEDLPATPFRRRTRTRLPPDPAGPLQAYLDGWLAAAREPTVGFRVLLRALVEVDDADRRAELTAVLLECTEPLVRLLHAGQQAGVFRRSLDAQVAAWELLQAVLGYALTGPRDVAAGRGRADAAVRCTVARVAEDGRVNGLGSGGPLPLNSTSSFRSPVMPRRLFVVLLVTVFAAAAIAGTPFQYPVERHGTGELRYIHGIPVLTVGGSPEEIGAATGLLTKSAAEGLFGYFDELLKRTQLDAVWPCAGQIVRGDAAAFPGRLPD